MIQDIAPHQFDNAYRPKSPVPDSYALYYEEHDMLACRREGEIDYPRFQDLEGRNPDIYEHHTYPSSIDRQDFYLLERVSIPAPSCFSMENTEVFGKCVPQHLAFAGITGWQLYDWYRDHHLCGRCGGLMKPDERERMLQRKACHTVEYPKISPAVIIGPTDGNRLLLSKYVGWTCQKYVLLTGFVEIGETTEETVEREIMEEVGLKVTNIRYYTGQPWSFSGALLIGFFCDLESPDEIALDGGELVLAEWFEREDIPDDDSQSSLAWNMIRYFRDHEIE